MVQAQNAVPKFLLKFTVLLLLFSSFYFSPIISFLGSVLVLAFSKESILVSAIGGFSLAYPALFFQPLITDDATRIFFVVKGMQNIPLSGLKYWLKMWAPDYLNYPLFTGLMYVVARWLQVEALPFIVAGVTFTAVFYTVWKFARIFEITRLAKILVLLSSVTWLNYLELISGMRFSLACALALFSIVDACFLDTKTASTRYSHLFWLIVPILIHPGVMILVIPVIVYIILNQKNFFSKWVSLIGTSVFGLVLILLNVFQNNNSYLRMISNRLNGYQSTTFDYYLSPQRLVHFFLALTLGLVAISMSSMMLKQQEMNPLFRQKVESLKRICTIFEIYFLISLISISFGMRLAVLVPMLFVLLTAVTTSRFTSGPFLYAPLLILTFVFILNLFYNISALHANFYGIVWFRL
ncbi:hypothetical protein [Furfurilactobacillus curtus]|uniref:Uncharacterized protein n=1 Tax=Furfurilactobacillus curtus TaxID=1746200 RepID=A0ABQ5JP20_9LACO